MKISRDASHLVVFWLIASVVATLLALNYTSASFIDGEFIPVGNDSFYHARRILDAAVGGRGFYQFDDTIHVPEGSWLTWPWAYDYLMSRLLIVTLAVFPKASPMAALAHTPLLFLFVNTALLTLMLRESGLRKEFIALALAVFALAPTTQGLHGVGMVDHHFIELTFVIATTWLGLRFFSHMPDTSRAAALGIVLGVAPAFHNGLFILQLPILLAGFVCWLHGNSINRSSGLTLSSSLLLSTLVALLPSSTFLAMHFEFATHSWFHLYIAACSAIYLVLLSRLDRSARNGAVLVVTALALSAPIVVEVVKAAGFLAGATPILDDIVEVKSPLDFWLESGEFNSVSRFYGMLIVLSPLLIVVAATGLFYRQSRRDLFLLSAMLIGIGLLSLQFRLHPFGSWALPVATLWLVQKLGDRQRWDRRVMVVAATVCMAVSLQPAVTQQLFARMPVGLTERYESSRPIYLALGDICAKEPGVVLAAHDDGHPIRFHSECSVIANNFLLTRQHGEKALLVHELLDTSPEDFLAAAPYVKYILVRPENLWQRRGKGIEAVAEEEVLASNPALIAALSRVQMPPGFEILGEIPVSDGRKLPYVRLVRIR